MTWDRVAVVGAGMIKFGELFEQSYEQMAAGAFKAAIASVDKGFDPSDDRRRDRRHPERQPLGPGRRRGQHGPERRRPLGDPVHPGGERLPLGFRRVPHRGDGRRVRVSTRWSS